MEEKPRYRCYEATCGAVFLGRDGEYDLYCKPANERSAGYVMARFGDDGDYYYLDMGQTGTAFFENGSESYLHSDLLEDTNPDYPTVEALRRARERGLIPERENKETMEQRRKRSEIESRGEQKGEDIGIGSLGLKKEITALLLP